MTMKHTWNVRFCAAWRMIWKYLCGLSLSISGFRWQSMVSIFSFSPWPSHYSSSSSMPSLWISHLPLPPPFSLFCPSLFSPLFLSHRISLSRSRCRNSLLHINELLISKAKRRPASQPPASCSQSYTSLSHPLSSSCAFSYSFPHSQCDFICMMSRQLICRGARGSFPRIRRHNKPFRVSRIIACPSSIVGRVFSKGSPKQVFSITSSHL